MAATNIYLQLLPVRSRAVADNSLWSPISDDTEKFIRVTPALNQARKITIGTNQTMTPEPPSPVNLWLSRYTIRDLGSYLTTMGCISHAPLVRTIHRWRCLEGSHLIDQLTEFSYCVFTTYKCYNTTASAA